MIVAGEASGDRHGAALVSALRRQNPDTAFEFFGAGGEEMRAAGVETLVDARDMAIIGIPEIARALGRLYGAFRRLRRAARARRPHAIVLIDWPDFNMRLAKKLRRDGFKIIYYISPQVWAWRRYRVRALRRDVERMLVILPFEEAFYRGEGIDVEYVGHPLVEAARVGDSRAAFAARHGLDAARPIIALLPGSRRKEIHYHLPIMLDAAGRLKGLRLAARDAEGGPAEGEPQFVLPLASTVSRQQVEAQVEEARGRQGLDLRVVERDTYNAVGHAEMALVASGTATVETALLGTPMVIVYRASEINFRLLRPLIRLDTFGMANLIAGRRIVPELIQHDATGEKLAETARAILEDPDRLAVMRRDLEEVRGKLLAGGSAAAARAAEAVMRAIST